MDVQADWLRSLGLAGPVGYCSFEARASEVPRLMVRVGRQTRLRRIQTKHVFH